MTGLWRTHSWEWISVLLALVPMLVTKYLPWSDFPQHVAMTSILAHGQDPEFGFASTYASRWMTPYALFYAFTAPLCALGLPALEACRLGVALAFALYVWSLGSVLRFRGVHPAFCVLSVPVLHNRVLLCGFAPCTVSLSLGFAAMAWFVCKDGTARAVGTGVLLLAAGLTHLYGFLLGFSWLLAYWLVGGGRSRANLVLALLGAGLAGLWARATFAGGLPPTLLEGPTWEKLRSFGLYTLGHKEDVLSYLCLGGLILVGVCSHRGRGLFAKDPVVAASLLFAAGHLVLYAVLPLHVAGPAVGFVNLRHAVLAVLVLPLAAGRNPVPWVRHGAVAGAVACSLFLTWRYLQFSQESGGLGEILRALPPRASVMQTNNDINGAHFVTYPYLLTGGYLQAERGGVYGVSFPLMFPRRLPVTEAPGSLAQHPNWGAEWSTGNFVPQSASQYEYVLYRGSPPATVPVLGPHLFSLVSASPPLYLLRRNGGETAP